MTDKINIWKIQFLLKTKSLDLNLNWHKINNQLKRTLPLILKAKIKQIEEKININGII